MTLRRRDDREILIGEWREMPLVEGEQDVDAARTRAGGDDGVVDAPAGEIAGGAS